MRADRVLSQDEIDSVFRKHREETQDSDPSKRAQLYDFRRPDRIAKDQLRAIHTLHDNFARSLASSLSAFLRAYVTVNLVSVEQLSFVEFSQSLSSPTCIVTLGLTPYEGNALLEVNPTLLFPMLEMLLGGDGKRSTNMEREITEIEWNILESVIRIILNDLRNSWQAVTNIDFIMESHETEPQLLQMLAPNEAVVAVGIEIRIGETAGMMNICVPSIIIKMLRQKFDQQWSLRKSETSDQERARILKIVKPSRVIMDARLRGPTLTVGDLLRLKPGDVLQFDYNVRRPVDFLMNGRHKALGQVVLSGNKRAFQIQAFKENE